MPTPHAIQTPSIRSRFIKQWSFFHPVHPCPEGAELKETWRLASLPNFSREETELILYEENLVQSRDALIAHLKGCVYCSQSQQIWNRLTAAVESAFARCPLTWLLGKPVVAH